MWPEHMCAGHLIWGGFLEKREPGKDVGMEGRGWRFREGEARERLSGEAGARSQKHFL